MQIQRRPPEGGRYIIQRRRQKSCPVPKAGTGRYIIQRQLRNSKATARFNGKGKVKGDGKIRTRRKNARRAVAGRAFGIRVQR